MKTELSSPALPRRPLALALHAVLASGLVLPPVPGWRAQTTRVSVSSTGAQGNSSSWNPSVSADGRFVAFRSDASDLVASDTNNSMDVFIHDRATRQTTRVSVSSTGDQAHEYQFFGDPVLAISANGRFVAFWSMANNLVAGDTNEVPDVFVHDRTTHQTSRASVSSTGEQGNRGSSSHAISGDGRFVAFVSQSNFHAG